MSSSSAGAELPSTLTVNTDRVAVGSTERLIFRAVYPVGQTIKLYSVAASNQTFLFNLRDNGAHTFRDVAANDGVYSNTMIAECTSEGVILYRAEMEGSADAPLEVALRCFTPATEAQVENSIAVAADVQQQLELLLQQQSNSSQGNASQVLQSIEGILRSSAEVDSATVLTTGQGVIWSTNEGLRFRVYVPLPDQRAAPHHTAKSTAAAASDELLRAKKAKGIAYEQAPVPEWAKVAPGIRSPGTVDSASIATAEGVDANVTGVSSLCLVKTTGKSTTTKPSKL